MEENKQKTDPKASETPESSQQAPVSPEQSHPHTKRAAFFALLVLVAIVAAIVFYLTNSTEPALAPDAQTVSQPLPDLTDDTETPISEEALSRDWVEIDANDFRIKLPDGWSFVLQDGNILISDCAEFECYELEQGTPATFVEVSGGRGGGNGFIMLIQPAGFSVEEATDGFMQIDGTESGFTFYTRVQNTEEESMVGPELPIGSFENLALQELPDGRYAYAYYTVLPDQFDPVNLVREMLSTFRLNTD